MDVLFLTVEEVIEIHADQVAHYGGEHGLRDHGLLLSAIAQPAATFGGTTLHMGLCEMAAAYLYHLISNHPFIDGNKRTGAVSAIVFLALNGVQMVAPEDEFEQMVWDVAAGQASKAEVAAFLEKHTQPL